jgi:hypothetical protein
VRVTLKDGSSIDASVDHKIYTARGWVSANELKPDSDFVSVTIQMPETTQTVARDSEITLVAYQLSDGGNTAGMLNFTNMTSAVISDWQRCADLECGGWSFADKRSQALTFRLLGGQAFRKKWDLYGLSKEKRCHPSIWGLPSRQVALFLNRFWACDGHVNKLGFECALASEKLIDDLCFLGRRLGVRFRKRYKKASYVKHGVRRVFDAWVISAYSTDAQRFLDTVGDVLGKEDACRKLRARLANTTRNTNFDVVPVGPVEIMEICKELGILGREPGLRSQDFKYRRHAIRRLLNQTAGQYVSRDKFIAFCKAYSYRGRYSHLATGDTAWERVVKVVPIGTLPVYDLTVPETENFVTNNIVVHNSVMGLLAPLALADAWYAESTRKGLTVDKSKFVALLLVPPGLQKQLALEYRLLAQHFRVPSLVFHALPISEFVDNEPTLHVYPYSKLSRSESTTFFRSLRPQAIITDEAHLLSDPDAVRTSRFLTYLADNPHVKVCSWTGSPTDSSIEDYAHLVGFALKERSPLPLDPVVIKEWASCIDPVDKNNFQADPGALLKGLVETGCQNPGEHVYKGFHRRLTETLGFVTVTSPAISCGIEIYERHPDLPLITGDRVPNVPKEDPRAPDGAWPGIADALQLVRGEGVRPDGEELLEAFAVARCARELASGFFYRWIFPNGEVESLIARWRDCRKRFRQEVREKMSARQEHLDSPYLCQLAAQRYYKEIPNDAVIEVLDEETGVTRLVDTAELPEWRSEHWPRWRDVKDLVKPSTEPVWIDDYLALDAVAWAKEHTGIIWYDHNAFGHRVAALGKLPIFGGGSKALDRLMGNAVRGVKGEDGSRSILLAIKAHGTGRDGLQRMFHKQLVANPLSSAKGWEQLFGRLHRLGQAQPSTITWFYRHTAELKGHVDQALRRAFYIEGTFGGTQKLRLGFRLNGGIQTGVDEV